MYGYVCWWFNVNQRHVPRVWAHSVCQLAVSYYRHSFVEIVNCRFVTPWKSQYLDDISTSRKTPRAAKDTKVCASEWEFGANRFQQNLWHRSQVVAKHWCQHNHSWTLELQSQNNVKLVPTKPLIYVSIDHTGLYSLFVCVCVWLTRCVCT